MADQSDSSAGLTAIVCWSIAFAVLGFVVSDHSTRANNAAAVRAAETRARRWDAPSKVTSPEGSSPIGQTGSSTDLPPVPETAEQPASGQSDFNALLAKDNPEADEERRALIRRWTEADPQTAAQWTEHLPPGQIRREALLQVAIGWGNSDPANAARWVMALPDEDKPLVGVALAYEAARTNPTIALEVAGSLEPSVERDRALEHAISQLAGTDSGGATAWALKVPEPVLRQRLVAAVAIAAAELDPSAAASLAAGSLNPGEEQNRAAVSIVERWAQMAPQDAADWVSRFPDNPARLAAAESLFSIWATRDRGAAADYLRQLPEGPLRQAASAGYSQALAAEAEPTPPS